jgi:hypothetical protein
MMIGFFTNRMLAVALVVMSITTPAAYGWQLNSSQGRAQSQKRITADRFIRTELFFGTDRSDSPAVTEEEWQQFLNEEITPRFPEGLTVLTGYGQFLNSKGQIIREISKLVILLYPESERKDKNNQIEQIRQCYKGLFRQESVLRVDDPLPVWVSF